MNFKQWFNLMESSGSDESIRSALISYKNNLDDELAKENFYKEILAYVLFWTSGRLFDKGRTTAEELASNVIEKVMTKMQDANFVNNLDPDRFVRYLAVVMSHAKIDAARRAAARERLSGSSIEASGHSTELGRENAKLKHSLVSRDKSVEEEQMRKEMETIVRSAVASLPKPEDRELANLIYYQNMTYEEIAKTLGIPLGTAKSRANTLKSKLRAALEEIQDN